MAAGHVITWKRVSQTLMFSMHEKNAGVEFQPEGLRIVDSLINIQYVIIIFSSL